MIKSILTATTLLISGIAFADVPNTFEAGSAIKASEMNENFTSIDNDINTNSDDISDLDSKTANYSDLETDVASLKAKVELLETLLASDDSFATAEFVGVSSTLTKGNAGGLNAMNQICNIDYSDSRMCTTKDISSLGVFPETPNYSGGNSDQAWVHNNSNILNIEAATASNSSTFTYEDWPNEYHNGGRGNCLNWSVDDTYTGTYLETYRGGSEPLVYPSIGSCSTDRYVACCK